MLDKKYLLRDFILFCSLAVFLIFSLTYAYGASVAQYVQKTAISESGYQLDAL